MDPKLLTKRVKGDGISLAVLVSREVFPTDAWVFLKFARADLLDPPPRGPVNALSNAKRAVENRVDVLLHAFGLDAHDNRDRWGYPQKARMLRRGGLTVPDVLENMITSVRNDLEHEYKIPIDLKSTRNSVDVAELFLLATDSKISQGFFRWIVGPRALHADYDPTSSRVSSLPKGAFGLLIDHDKKTLSLLDQGEDTIGVVDIDSGAVADLFKVLHASVEPGTTKVVGPLTEAVFGQSFL